jgi:hypothetical protein
MITADGWPPSIVIQRYRAGGPDNYSNGTTLSFGSCSQLQQQARCCTPNYSNHSTLQSGIKRQLQQLPDAVVDPASFRSSQQR